MVAGAPMLAAPASRKMVSTRLRRLTMMPGLAAVRAWGACRGLPVTVRMTLPTPCPDPRHTKINQFSGHKPGL
jgi:hypothetical protein